MLRLRYSADSGVELEGSREELRAIVDGIQGLIRTGSGPLTFTGAMTGSPQPYDAWLPRLVLEITAGPTRATVLGDSALHISGDAECLGALASFFEVPATARPGWHTHHEHYAGNRWVDAESEPLIISLDERDERS